jgi:hypothetical protein
MVRLLAFAGAWGIQDLPFIDFKFTGFSMFGKVPLDYPLQPGETFTSVQGLGAMQVFRVSEPGTVALFGLGVGFVGLASRRRSLREAARV